MISIAINSSGEDYERVTGHIDGITIAWRERRHAVTYDDLAMVIYETCPQFIVGPGLDLTAVRLDTAAATMLQEHGNELAAIRNEETLRVLYDWVQDRRGHRWIDLDEAAIPAVMWCLPEVSSGGRLTGRISVMPQPEYRLRRWALRRKGQRVRGIEIGHWPPIVHGLWMDQEREAPWHDARLTGRVIDVRLPRLQEQAYVRLLLGES